MVGLSFYGIFWNFLVIGEYNIKIIATYFSPLFLLHCHNQVDKIVTLIFRFFCFVTKMPALDRNVKVTRENCGVQITKLNLAGHKSRCSGGTLYCTQCPNFFTKSRDDLNYHIAKQHSAAGPSIRYKCKLCHAEFPGFLLHVNTKTFNMEHNLGLERAILMWRT